MRERRRRLTAERLRKALRYDRRSGAMFWKESGPRRRLGQRAGCINSIGYWLIGLDGYRYLGHELAWLHVYGKWPGRLEFVNGDTTDIAIKNLREHVTMDRCAETKVCRLCSGVFNRNPQYSDTQWRDRAFCSRQCAQDHARRAIDFKRPCRECGSLGPFHRYMTSSGHQARRTVCKRCWNKDRKRRRRLTERANKIANPELYLFRRMRENSRQRGHRCPFTYKSFLREIGGRMPEVCPVLGIKLDPSAPANSPHLPTVDRFDSTKPYRPGNVAIISWRANALKKDGTVSEARMLADWMDAMAKRRPSRMAA
jgi:hypothetical protein